MTQSTQPILFDFGSQGTQIVYGERSGYDTHLEKEYIEKYSVGSIFIETGTYLGETLRMIRDLKCFQMMYSIELNDELYRRNVELFQKDENIHIILGDSPDKIRDILSFQSAWNSRCTFWLDAHASGPLPGGAAGGSPLLEELRAIKESSERNDHTIFMDDRRLFNSPEWDNLSEETTMEFLKSINPNYTIEYLDGETPLDVIVAWVPPYVEKGWDVVNDVNTDHALGIIRPGQDSNQ